MIFEAVICRHGMLYGFCLSGIEIKFYICANFNHKISRAMPLYDYKCYNCEAEKEVQHSMSEIGKIEVLCDHCGQHMKKMLSVPALVGFDDVGRSISKKDRENGSNGKGKTTKKESTPAKTDSSKS